MTFVCLICQAATESAAAAAPAFASVESNELKLQGRLNSGKVHPLLMCMPFTLFVQTLELSAKKKLSRKILPEKFLDPRSLEFGIF